MTVERTSFVRIPEEFDSEIINLAASANECLVRASKLPPGDRTEFIRFESINSKIDQLAIALLTSGEAHVTVTGSTTAFGQLTSSILGLSEIDGRSVPEKVSEWIKSGRKVVAINSPNGRGETKWITKNDLGPLGTAKRWKSEARRIGDATKERFEYMVTNALNDENSGAYISPSGVSNRVLTETLHRYAKASSSEHRKDLAVRYRDGSSGPNFPMRSLKMTSAPLEDARCLKFTLLSIRHVDMDADVDGAWLRNSRISLARQAGLTDQIVFDISQKQLLALDPSVPTTIEMFQTGLEPAIMGFYRAVVLHLLQFPGAISIQPQFFAGGSNFDPGPVWAA